MRQQDEDMPQREEDQEQEMREAMQQEDQQMEGEGLVEGDIEQMDQEPN